MIRCLWDGTVWNGQAWVPDRGQRFRQAGPYVVSDLPAYKSPLGTGVVEGRTARREEMKRHNCREVDPTEFNAVYRNPKFAKKYGLELGGDPLPRAKRMNPIIGPKSLGGDE